MNMWTFIAVLNEGNESLITLSCGFLFATALVGFVTAIRSSTYSTEQTCFWSVFDVTKLPRDCT